MLQKMERVERRSTGQTQEYEVYPQSHGLRELDPRIPLKRTPGSHDPSLPLHRDRGMTTEAPPVYLGEIQQQEAEVGQTQTGEKGRFLTVRLRADNPPGPGVLHRERTHYCPPPGNPTTLWLSHTSLT